jgi:starch-binding outer membrane protein, SusD/RagB family
VGGGARHGTGQAERGDRHRKLRHNFTIPGSPEWINGVQLTNQDFVRVVNSYYARLLVYSPRTWEQRNAVDWNEVLRRIDSGITEDFAPQGLLNVWESNMRRLLSRVRTSPSDHVRPDTRALGPADTAGNFQTWIATPSANRVPFQIRTPDRRIHGAGGPATRGLYVGYNTATIWALDRGTYRRSFYFYHRGGTGDTWYVGPQVTMSRTEMDLLKAEALIRLNRAAGGRAPHQPDARRQRAAAARDH